MASNAWITDPDELALLLVQQFLRDRGLEEALAATERASGRQFVEEKLGRGSMLLELVHEKVESELAASVSEMEIEEREEEDALLQGNSNDWPREVSAEFCGLHNSNILAVRLWSTEGVFFTAAGDAAVRCVDATHRAVRWSCNVGGGACIAIALHPKPREHPLLLATSMDGTVSLLNALDGTLLHAVKAHSKYAHRVLWTATGGRFATASHDAFVRAFACRQGHGADTAAAPFEETWHMPFQSTVEDIEPLKDEQIAVASRNDHCLRILDLASNQEAARVNLNAHGDSHLSFVAKHLALSPCGCYLLVSTDGGRIIMLNTTSWKQVRNFYGVPLEQFGNPCAAWTPSQHYVVAAAAGGTIWVFHVGSSKAVYKAQAHGINVRDLNVDAGSGMLATCSYDKTVKLWRCQNPKP